MSSLVRSKVFMYVQKVDLLPFDNKNALIMRLKLLVNEDIIANYALILHDHDNKENGEKVDPHYHIWLYSKNRITVGKIAKKLGDKQQQFESMTKRGNSLQSSVENSLLYLIHKTSNAQNKYQYNAEDVEANFNYQNFVSKLEEDSKGTVISSSKPELILNDFKNENITKPEAIKALMSIGATCYAKCANELDKIEDGLCQLRFERWRKNKEKTNEKIKIVWVFGAAGTGKTRYCRDFCKRKGFNFFVTTASNDLFQDYNGEKVLIIDELRPDTFLYRDLLQILDPYDFDQKKTIARYHNARIMSDYIFVTSPFDPLTFYNKMHNNKHDGFDQLYRRIGLILRFNDDFIEEMELQNDRKHYRVTNMKQNQFSQKYDSRKNKFSLDDLEGKL